MTAADKYYLIAKDNYPCYPEEALTALEYGLSHDDAHAGLLTLYGEICYKDLSRHSEAAAHFRLALYHDPAFLPAYYHYIHLLCITEDVAAAETLIKQALKVKGIDKGRVWHSEALLYEKQGMYTLALASIRNACMWSTDAEETEVFGKEKKRIKKKVARAEKTEEPAVEQEIQQVK